MKFEAPNPQRKSTSLQFSERPTSSSEKGGIVFDLGIVKEYQNTRIP
jgi:hypothetical protein